MKKAGIGRSFCDDYCHIPVWLIALITWMLISVGFRRLLCELTLNVIPPRSESLLDELLKSDTSLWKSKCAMIFQILTRSTK